MLDQVQRDTEATLKLMAAAGEIAWAMWRLLMADRGGHEAGPLEPGGRYEGELPEPAARDARQRIEAVRNQHEHGLDVYVMACFSGALAATGDSDVAALVLLDLATLHVRSDNPGIALQLIQIADTDTVSERRRQMLARCRDMLVGDNVQEQQGMRTRGTEWRGGGW